MAGQYAYFQSKANKFSVNFSALATLSSSSQDQAVPNTDFSLDSPESPQPRWSAALKVAFRFVVSFLLVAVFPFPFNSFGGSFYPAGSYERLWFAAASSLCDCVLHVAPAPSSAAPILLMDNNNGYLELLCFVILATLATIVWTLRDRRRPNYHSLHEWLRVYVRYALGFTMLAYGMDKVFALQFNSSLPGPGRLAEPLGNCSPFALMWTFDANWRCAGSA